MTIDTKAMREAMREATREALAVSALNRLGNANIALCDEIDRLREELRHIEVTYYRQVQLFQSEIDRLRGEAGALHYVKTAMSGARRSADDGFRDIMAEHDAALRAKLVEEIAAWLETGSPSVSSSCDAAEQIRLRWGAPKI